MKKYKIIESWIKGNYSIELPGSYPETIILTVLQQLREMRGHYSNHRAVEILTK